MLTPIERRAVKHGLIVRQLAHALELVLMTGAHPGRCVDLEGLELAPGAPCPWHLAATAQHQAEARQLLGELRAQGWRW